MDRGDILKMADITVLPEFSRDGDKRGDGLTELNGFPQALKPARQWMNFILNKITVKMNEVIGRVNSNTHDIIDEAQARENADNDKFDKSGGTITGDVTIDGELTLGTSSLVGKNGHTYLPNGYIYQFGYIALGDMTVIPSGNTYERYAIIDLPIDFPTEAINPNANIKATNTGYLSDVFAQAVNATTTQITVKTGTVSSSDVSDGIDGVFWSVIGR